MQEKNAARLREQSPYSAAMTREQFLFHETRITAKLVHEGLTRAEVVDRIVKENLFQFPTERSLKLIASACLRRLDALENPSLVDAIATERADVAKQICLFAMMRHLNVFFARLQSQDDWVATWSDSTVTKVKQVLVKTLVENGYLDGTRSERLNPVLIAPVLETAIRNAGLEIALPAYNCFV